LPRKHAFIRFAQSLFDGLSRPPNELGSNRGDYKAVWNALSGTEVNAKLAVSGSDDEASYRETGEHTKRLLVELVGVSSSDVVLEIGAGVGRAGAFLAPICKQWIGTDVSENMIHHARRRLAKFENVRMLVTNGYDLDGVPSESADVVYSTVVFMHLDEWERFSYIEEGFRILRPGGRMMVDNVDLTSDKGWEFFNNLRRIPPTSRPAQISKTSTPQELATYFTRAGFTDIKQQFADLWVYTFAKKPNGP
jgi:SAM-dependent methyltransferase